MKIQKKRLIPYLGVVIIVTTIILLLLTLWTNRATSPSPQQTNETSESNHEVATDPQESSPPEQTPTKDYSSKKGVAIHVDYPVPSSVVTTPVKLSGTVPGTWSFEASFPVEVQDANHQKIGEWHATIEGNWMTDEQVPFSAEVNFDTPASKTGYIVLRKDNPSGLPENEDYLEIPIKF